MLCIVTIHINATKFKSSHRRYYSAPTVVVFLARADVWCVTCVWLIHVPVLCEEEVNSFRLEVLVDFRWFGFLPWQDLSGQVLPGDDQHWTTQLVPHSAGYIEHLHTYHYGTDRLSGYRLYTAE